jgi:hypothetical protein
MCKDQFLVQSWVRFVPIALAAVTSGCPSPLPAPPPVTVQVDGTVMTASQEPSPVSTTERSQTAAFLGPERGWVACRVELWEVDGKGTPGALNAVVSGAGRVDVQAVTWQIEDRYRFEVGAPAVRDALRTLVEVDLLGAREPGSVTVRGTGVRIVLVNPRGGVREVEVASQPAPSEAFQRSHAALRALVSPSARGARPIWSGGPTGRRPFP